ncbi:chemotaxis protein CheW [Neobacillus sedimentimangrovi]|uniref:Chemotaxis protein CheW n=1 Tax=Neobacillus sedimentimangrovi TaxID=2699460 RepID=A0ABS8QJK2_9BACI|nr:chemotaxis protein CheW [Neobacillus sedimentimangrovi]MCD4839180.1 chemotaxis protein CheW [Neobacillus sedimentimangrovi]
MQGQNDMTDFKALIFKVGEEEYGVHINQVISIERMQEITSYPNRPAHVLGVTVMREVVTPVVDLRSALMGEALVPSDSSRIILVQVEDKQIGLIVDAATDVLDIKLDTIQHPNLLDSKDVSYLKGISKMDDRLIILLDIEKLLEKTTNIDELKEIKDVFQD